MRAGVVRIVGIYAVFAALWILLSDRAVGALSDDAARITALSMWKGWFFVAVTSGLLYLLMRQLVDQQSRTLAQLREREASYRALTEQVPAIIYRAGADSASTTTYISPQVEALGFSPEEWLADPNAWLDLDPPRGPRPRLDEVAVPSEPEHLATEYRLATRSGRWLTIRDEARLIQPDDGGEAYLQGLMLDVTDDRKAQEDLRHRCAFHDHPGPACPTAPCCSDRLSQMLRTGQREGRVGCLTGARRRPAPAHQRGPRARRRGRPAAGGRHAPRAGAEPGRHRRPSSRATSSPSWPAHARSEQRSRRSARVTSWRRWCTVPWHPP